jgi:hypothetical protein
MKKRWGLFVLVFLGVLIVNSVYAQTYVWKKYDDFKSSVIDTNKWYIDDSSATISIENGKAKFVHNGGFPGDPAWLKIKKKITNVWGIKATIEFESCNFADPAKRDVKAMVGANLGEEAATPTNRVFCSLDLEPYFNNADTPRLYGIINLWDISVSPNVLIADLFAGYFLRENGGVAADVIGIPFTVTMEWTTKYVKFTVANEGKATYNFEKTYKVKSFKDPNKAFVGIGTMSSSGGGPCTVCFDDVYVLRKQ